MRATTLAKRIERIAMAGAKRSVRKADTAAGLAALIKAAPKLSSPKDARGRVDEWLDEIARTAAGKALTPLLAAEVKSRSAKLAAAVAAIAEASPFLWELIRAEPDRFLGILEAEPEGHFAAVIADVTGLPDTSKIRIVARLREKERSGELRRMEELAKERAMRSIRSPTR